MPTNDNSTLILGETYLCKICKIKPTYLILELPNGFKGVCHISEISDYLVKDINMLFSENTKEYFQLIKIDHEQNTYHLSYKKINPKQLKSHKKIIPTHSGFTNLKKNTDNLLK